MGNCVTVYKSKEDPAAMNLSSTQIQSPTKTTLEHDTSFRNLSKTENFFDSQPWLESDCEDFFSVNGDSASNSPNHQKDLKEGSQCDKDHSMDRTQDAVPQPSPTETKKQLIELFRESFNNDEVVNKHPSLEAHLEEKATTFNFPPKSTSRSPYESVPNSVHSSEATPYRKEKSALSTQCCLPSLVRNMSSGERKKRLSPAQN